MRCLSLPVCRRIAASSIVCPESGLVGSVCVQKIEGLFLPPPLNRYLRVLLRVSRPRTEGCVVMKHAGGHNVRRVTSVVL